MIGISSIWNGTEKPIRAQPSSRPHEPEASDVTNTSGLWTSWISVVGGKHLVPSQIRAKSIVQMYAMVGLLHHTYK